MGAISSAKIFNFRIEKGKTLNSSKHLAINLLLVPLTMKYVKVWFLKKSITADDKSPDNLRMSQLINF